MFGHLNAYKISTEHHEDIENKQSYWHMYVHMYVITYDILKVCTLYLITKKFKSIKARRSTYDIKIISSNIYPQLRICVSAVNLIGNYFCYLN